MKQLLFLFVVIFSGYNAFALGSLQDCLNIIQADKENWHNKLFNINNDDRIFKELDAKNTVLLPEHVIKHKEELFSLIALNIEALCPGQIAEILEMPNSSRIELSLGDEEFHVNFPLHKVLKYMSHIRTGILVINNRNLQPGRILEKTSVPQDGHFFSDGCSDWSIWDNLKDSAAVNRAGQAAFIDARHSGSSNEFFLDFAVKDNMRAFPGLVLMDKTWSTTESIVAFQNFELAESSIDTFAKNLQNSACSDDELAAYLVALDVKKTRFDNGTSGWAVGLLSTAGAGLVYTTYVSLVAAGTISGTLAGLAAGTAVVPVWGWIASGVLLTGAGIAALIPRDIEKIDQVMIVSNPYKID
ncbi:MAG: hypothetical protein IKN73_01940 [Alphaproteobacteria bacterium]|nr:hypothetical protein [Alphaproteobacteria bacterium]